MPFLPCMFPGLVTPAPLHPDKLPGIPWWGKLWGSEEAVSGGTWLQINPTHINPQGKHTGREGSAKVTPVPQECMSPLSPPVPGPNPGVAAGWLETAVPAPRGPDITHQL